MENSSSPSRGGSASPIDPRSGFFFSQHSTTFWDTSSRRARENHDLTLDGLSASSNPHGIEGRLRALLAWPRVPQFLPLCDLQVRRTKPPVSTHTSTDTDTTQHRFTFRNSAILRGPKNTAIPLISRDLSENIDLQVNLRAGRPKKNQKSTTSFNGLKSAAQSHMAAHAPDRPGWGRSPGSPLHAYQPGEKRSGLFLRF